MGGQAAREAGAWQGKRESESAAGFEVEAKAKAFADQALTRRRPTAQYGVRQS
jgi:hypothetical protein